MAKVIRPPQTPKMEKIRASNPLLVRILHAALHRARTDPDLVLKDLADFTGVTLMTLNRWERGESVPYPRNIRLLELFATAEVEKTKTWAEYIAKAHAQDAEGLTPNAKKRKPRLIRVPKNAPTLLLDPETGEIHECEKRQDTLGELLDPNKRGHPPTAEEIALKNRRIYTNPALLTQKPYTVKARGSDIKSKPIAIAPKPVTKFRKDGTPHLSKAPIPVLGNPIPTIKRERPAKNAKKGLSTGRLSPAPTPTPPEADPRFPQKSFGGRFSTQEDTDQGESNDEPGLTSDADSMPAIPVAPQFEAPDDLSDLDEIMDELDEEAAPHTHSETSWHD